MTDPATEPAPVDVPVDTPADPGNTDPAELTAPLEPDDDAYDRISLVNTDQPDPLEEAPGEPV